MCKKNKYRLVLSIGSTILFLVIFILTNIHPPHKKDYHSFASKRVN